jgi:SAM-dependent methyltransferase
VDSTWEIISERDDFSTLYFDGEFYYRVIRPSFRTHAQGVLKICQDANFFDGRIENVWLFDTNSPEVTLVQKALPQIPPENWSLSMLRDVAIFHVRLLEDLNQVGLTLKDALPSNYFFTFEGIKLVDFSSITKSEEVLNLSWLRNGSNPNHPHPVLRSMFLPQFIVPLLQGLLVSSDSMREMLKSEQNFSENQQVNTQRLMILRRASLVGVRFALKLSLRVKSLIVFNLLLKIIFFVCNLQRRSSYSNYYLHKNENQSTNQNQGWVEKQQSIYELLLKFNPKRVLDLGSNTGWYSKLASENGASVLAADIDEGCITELRSESAISNLKIIPFYLDLSKEIQQFNNQFRPAWIGSDLVLCLGLIHHLILGRGHAFEQVAEILHAYTSSVLILEFVGIDDDKISSETDFFPHYLSSNQGYNIDELVKGFQKFFELVEVRESNPITRQILVFRKLAL